MPQFFYSSYEVAFSSLIFSLLLLTLLSCKQQEEVFAELEALQKDLDEGKIDKGMLVKINFTLSMEEIKSEGEDYLLLSDDEIEARIGNTLYRINEFGSRKDYQNAKEAVQQWMDKRISAKTSMDVEMVSGYPSKQKVEDGDEVLGLQDFHPDAVPAPEGGMQDFFDRIGRQLRYPAAERKSGIEGKVFLRVFVDAQGKLTEVEVLKGVSPALDAAAVEAVKNAGAWIPGEVNGKKVASSIRLPIGFKLQ